MKPPYIAITQDDNFAEYKIDPDYAGVEAIKVGLLKYSVTNDAARLPNAIFVLMSLPAGIRTIIGKTHRAGCILHIDLFIDENWKFSFGMRTNDSQWYFCGKPVPEGLR